MLMSFLTRGTLSPGPPDTLSRAPLRRRAPFAWLALASLRSLAAAARSPPPVARRSAMPDVLGEPIEPRRLQGSRKCRAVVGRHRREGAIGIRVRTEVPGPRVAIELLGHVG